MADDDSLSADVQRMMYWMNDPSSLDISAPDAPLPKLEQKALDDVVNRRYPGAEAEEAPAPKPAQAPPATEAPEKEKPAKPKKAKAPKAPEPEKAPEPAETGTPEKEDKPIKKGISMRDRIRYFDPTFDTMDKSEGGKKMEDEAMPSGRGDSEPRKMAYRTVTMGEGKDPIPMTVVDAKTGKVLFRLD